LGIASLIIAAVAQWSTPLLVPWFITGEILGAVTAVFGIIGAIASVFGGIIVGVVEIVRSRGAGMSSSIASSTSMVLSWTEIEIMMAEQFKICPF